MKIVLTAGLAALLSCSDKGPYHDIAGSYLRYTPLEMVSDTLLKTEVSCIALHPDSTFCRTFDIILIDPSGLWESYHRSTPRPETGSFRTKGDTVILYYDNILLLSEQELAMQGDTLNTLWYKVASGLHGPADDTGPDRYIKNEKDECVLGKEHHQVMYHKASGKSSR